MSSSFLRSYVYTYFVCMYVYVWIHSMDRCIGGLRVCFFLSLGVFNFVLRFLLEFAEEWIASILLLQNSRNPKENQFVGSRFLGENVSERRRGVSSFLCLMRMVGSLLYCCCGHRFVVVVVVGLSMLRFLSCFGVKTGFANYWLELLLQVLRWPNGSVVPHESFVGRREGSEARWWWSGWPPMEFQVLLLRERERERERFEREHGEIRNQSVHPSAWELEFWYQQPKCLVWGGWY